MQNQNKSVSFKDKDTLLSMHGILYVCILFFLLSLALSDSPYHIISYHIDLSHLDPYIYYYL